MGVAITLRQYLDDQGVDYEVLEHTPTATSSLTAHSTHLPGDLVAKAVVLRDESGYMVAVLPASHHIDLEQLQSWLGRNLRLASEEDASRLFADCALGAFPAIGAAYGLQVAVEESLAGQLDVYVEGGDHTCLLHMSGEQFGGLMKNARHGHFSHHD